MHVLRTTCRVNTTSASRARGKAACFEQSLDYRDASGTVVRTVDDETATSISDYTDFVNDANGLVLKSTFYWDPGPDGVWFTPDDEALDIQEFALDKNGDLLTSTWSHCNSPESCFTLVTTYHTAH